tara:strand:- start:7448 stop:7648 length:201 start_codon:yes stop_codon:yes gene_type:complete
MNQFNIEKIPLKVILEGLTDLYERGFEYFDLTITITEGKQDILNISVIPSYQLPPEEDSLDYEDLI